jgi:hypothetical protein
MQTVETMLGDVKQISEKLKLVGEKSEAIREDAETALDNICPSNSDIVDTAGMDVIGIAEEAKADLKNLAGFIKDGLETLDESLVLVRSSTESARGFFEKLNFWDWKMKLVCTGLFVLPSFFALGVGFVMLGIDVKAYQSSLSYFFLPLFTVTIIACCIVCCLILPFSATTADACSGGGVILGGPDDTALTIYRNLMGNDTGIVFQFVAFYTQQCNPEYEPFGFLETYLNDLDKAIDSTETAVITLEDNQDFLEEQCGRTFDDVLIIVKDMSNNLKLLQQQADRSLELVKCEKINKLYVETFHNAGCTYSIDALGWIFASSLVISVCGLVMIMLRSAYYPEEQLDLGDAWIKSPTITEQASDHSLEDLDSDPEDRVVKCESPKVRRSSPPLFVAKWNNKYDIEIDNESTVPR